MSFHTQTKEQRQATFKDAGMTPISVSGLQEEQTPLDFTQQETLTFDELPEEKVEIEVPKATEKETEKIGLISKLRELTGVTGEAEAFRREQEAAPELEAIRTRETDLVGQMKRLVAEQKQLDVERTAIPARMQEEARGRGITVGGLRPLTAGELRKNLLRQADVTSRGLFVSANLDATRGNIASAMDKIDRAVDAKFGAKKAELDKLLADLELVEQLPDLTFKEKQQLAEQKAIYEQEAEADKIEREEDLRKGKFIVKTIQDNPGISAETIRAMSVATSTVAAAQIASEAGVFVEEQITTFTTQNIGGVLYEVEKDATGRVVSTRPILGGEPTKALDVPPQVENIFDLGIDAGEGDIIIRNGRQFRVDPGGDLIPVDAQGDLSTLTPFEAQGLEFRLGRQAFGSRISDKEGEKVSKFVQAGITAGKTENDILDTILGFNVKRNEPLGRSLQNTLVGFGAENGLADFDMVGLARLLNADKTVGAMTKVENSGMKEAKELSPEGFISEATTIAAADRSNTLRELIESLDDSPIGVVKGTMESWLGRLRGKEATAIGTKIVSAVAEMRKRLLGSQVTPTENIFLSPKVPILGDSPENFMIKLQELKSDPLLQLNSIRGTVGLPQLTEDTLLDKNQRVKLYEGSGQQFTEGQSGITSSGIKFTIE